MALKLLLDSANPKYWEELFPSGIFSGITTNPTLLKNANQPCCISSLESLVKQAESLGCHEIHLQAWGENEESLIETGLKLAKLESKKLKVFVKIPTTFIGCKATKVLIRKNISITLTACYEPKQILIAESLNASYIAPYLGRIGDTGINGLAEVIKMQEILNGTNSNCKLLVASLRDLNEITKLASQGVDVFTINPELALKIFNSPDSDKASSQFNKDAKIA